MFFFSVQLTRITDTSAAEARAGKDIQGIPWERLQITRSDYRKARLVQYKNYENFPQSGELMDKVSIIMKFYLSMFVFFALWMFQIPEKKCILHFSDMQASG